MRVKARAIFTWFSRFTRRYQAGLFISGTACLLSLTLYGFLYLVSAPNPLLRFLADIELRTLDVRFRLRGARLPGPQVVIVAIDQKSQDVLGRWPFPRSKFAQAVDFLQQAGARAVAFDVTFPQPDENSALQALRTVNREYEAVGEEGPKSARFASDLKRLLAGADNDRQFAEALSRFDNVVLGYFFLWNLQDTASQNKKLVSDFEEVLSYQAYPQVVHPEYGKLFACAYCDAVGVSPNLRIFAENAKNFGFFNVVPDSDGTVRRVPVIVRFQNSYYPSLDVAAALAYTNRPLDQVAVVFNSNGLERIDFGALSIPTDPDGYVQIDFHGPERTFPTFSMADVVQRKLSPDLFRNRLVLVGRTGTGIEDPAVTPFSRMNFPGVEVHANFIDDILNGHFLRRGPRENLIDIGFILMFSLAAGVLLTVVPPVRATLVLVVFAGFFLWLAYYLFAAHRIWIAAFLPTATLGVNYAGIVSYRFFFEEREKKKVRGAFQQYVSPGVINQLLERPDLLRLGGEEKELTAMFSDIRGFTTLSEGLSPGDLVDLLNEYLSEMTDVIFRNWGTLDKYIGDAIMAFWGAPYPQADHPLRACHAALEMLDALKRLQEKWESEGRPRIDFGVGINTGPMLVGNMGSRRRFNFTIMGDNVNLASRLEGLNKQFGTRLIVSETTYQRVRDAVITREIDLIRVKGKMKPVKIFELLGNSDDADRHRDLVGRFHDGLQAYRTGHWDVALDVFEDLLRDFPGDAPSKVFAKRCQELRVQPPEGAWDGVYVMKTK